MTWRIETEQWTANVYVERVLDDEFAASVPKFVGRGTTEEEARETLLWHVKRFEESARLLAPGKLTHRELEVAKQVTGYVNQQIALALTEQAEEWRKVMKTQTLTRTQGWQAYAIGQELLRIAGEMIAPKKEADDVDASR